MTTYKIFKERRERLISQLKDNEAIIVASQPIYYRQPDIPYPYRQDSFFYYLTGFEEPQSCLVLKKNPPSSTLFVREKNFKKERWDGLYMGPKKAQEVLLMDCCESIESFDQKILSLLEKVSSIYQIRQINEDFDRQLDRVIKLKKSKAPKLEKNFNHFLNIKDKIAEMRMIKSLDEIDNIKKACSVTEQAHVAVMKKTCPGMSERHLHGTFIQTIMEQGSARESYTGIFASGKNALILHYTDNNQKCQDGDFMLVDAGAEWNYYASDITRTFPVNGRFTSHQKILYNNVLYVQKEAIKMIRPGLSFKSIQKHTQELMLERLKTDKILPSKSTLKDLSQVFPHNFGHFLGLDVHDVGVLKKGEKSFILEPGMVITVEPGIYITEENKDAPDAFKGMGIRIEDNILVTKNGYENLSQSIPKEIDEIEEVMSSSS